MKFKQSIFSQSYQPEIMPGKSGECESLSDETNESNNTCRSPSQTIGLAGQLQDNSKVAKTEKNRLQLIQAADDVSSDKERVVQLQEENFAASLNQQLSKVIYYSKVNTGIGVFELCCCFGFLFMSILCWCVWLLSGEANLDERVC